MAELNQFVALRLVLPGWPTHLISIPPQIDHIGLAEFETTSSGTSSLNASGTLLIIDEIIFDIALIPGISVALLNNGEYTEINFEFEFENEWFTGTLKTLSATLRIQSDLLKRMEKSGADYIEAPPNLETGEPQPVEITLEGPDVSLNSYGEFTITFPEGPPELTIQPFMIGNSGIVVDIQKLKLILSAADAELLPETIPSDWRGVYREEATIYLPEGYPIFCLIQPPFKMPSLAPVASAV